ncbi:helix-turn-helix transcriptional regulator [Candidatus Zixiibacteriota bacterium]
MPKSGVRETLQNVLWILRKVQSGRPVNKKELAIELDRSERQIRRYLEVLTEVGFHFETDEQGCFRGQVRLLPHSDQDLPLDLLSVSREELTLLYLQLSGIQQVGSPEQRAGLLKKIQNAMGSDEIDFQQLTAMMLSHERAYKSYDSAESRAVIATLLEALYWNKRCMLSYRIPHEDFDRVYELEPYRIMDFDGGLYCYCYIPDAEKTRLLAVERIKCIEITDSWFALSNRIEKEIEDHLTNAFRLIDDGEIYKVELEFTADQAPYIIERVWHPSQKLVLHGDGTVTLYFEASGIIEITKWILGWGGGLYSPFA